MKRLSKVTLSLFSLWWLSVAVQAQDAPALRELVQSRLNQEYPNLFELYKDLHRHPELSFHEEKTSERIAEEFQKAGCEVASRVGGYGVVGVLRNGAGPAILVRTDTDALPEPVLLVTGGVSLAGLRPTAASVPGGERLNRMTAPCEIATVDNRISSEFFMEGYVLLKFYRLQQSIRMENRISQRAREGKNNFE